MKDFIGRIGRTVGALALLAALAACNTELYSDLSEREANDMLGALLTEGIDAEKTGIGDGVFTITVANGDVQGALAVLDAQGLPKGSRESIGQVFAKSGIVSSPFEERVRYIYALGEEVGQTIQQIDGVMVARVHIVMPEEPELGQELKPSSAAVFIKQKPGYDLDFLMPQVRRLVANAIEGVAYDDVTVVLVEAQPQLRSDAAPIAQWIEVAPGLRVEAGSANYARYMLMGMAAGGLALLALVGFLALRLLGARKRAGSLAAAEAV